MIFVIKRTYARYGHNGTTQTASEYPFDDVVYQLKNFLLRKSPTSPNGHLSPGTVLVKVIFKFKHMVNVVLLSSQVSIMSKLLLLLQMCLNKTLYLGLQWFTIVVKSSK